MVFSNLAIHGKFGNFSGRQHLCILSGNRYIHQSCTVIPVSDDLNFLVRDKDVVYFLRPLVEDIFIR